MWAAGRRSFDAVVGAATFLLYLVAIVPAARLRSARRRAAGLPPRVVWAPIPIIGIRYASLADRLQGFPSETLVYDVYSINARGAFDHVLDRFKRVPVVRRLVPYGTFLWASLRYDVFCLYFDGGLLHATPWWRLELALLRLAGRRIVVLPYGGDARLASATRALTPWNWLTDVPPGSEDRDEAEVRERIAAFDRYADVMLGCNDLVEELPRVDGVFRYPFDTQAAAAPGAPPPERDEVVVLHAPNHRHYKGTRYLLEAVEELRRRGVNVRLDLVEGTSNDEVQRRIAAADIVADQFLAGSYALFAIEAMAAGRPVVCYMNEHFRRWHPEWDDCPIVSASPDELADVLGRLAADPELRREAGARGPAYVERWHSLESVGRDMAAIYRRLWR